MTGENLFILNIFISLVCSNTCEKESHVFLKQQEQWQGDNAERCARVWKNELADLEVLQFKAFFFSQGHLTTKTVLLSGQNERINNLYFKAKTNTFKIKKPQKPQNQHFWNNLRLKGEASGKLNVSAIDQQKAKTKQKV